LCVSTDRDPFSRALTPVHQLSAAKNTPPSIDDGMHPGRLVRGQDEKLYRVGESGWWWERMGFGGSAAEVVHAPGETGWTYPV